MERFLEELLPLERSFSQALWQSSCTGRSEDSERLDRIEGAYRGLFNSRERYHFLKALSMDGWDPDPLLRRQLEILLHEFEANQMAGPTLRRLIALRVEIESLHNNFRARLGDAAVSDNQLREILRTSTSSDQLRSAWEASKQIGDVMAPKILELVELRNSVARSLGYNDFQEMSLKLDEVDREWLFPLLRELEEITAAPFQALKERLDGTLAARFGISPADLFPWHYGDPFFQTTPRVGAVDLDEFYRHVDLPELTASFYEGLGLGIRDLLEGSDLYEREGKCQHAFCTDIDKRGDVRVLANLKPNEHWMGTMLHEFGHAVYDREFDPELPHILRGPAHTSSTEAIAMMFGRASKDRRFLEVVVGVEPSLAARAAAAAREELRSEQPIFLRWALVVVHFERELYRDPRQDLSGIWWDLVERFQGLRRPPGRSANDWAAKIHIATSPVYYQNYILGELAASQIQRHILTNVLGSSPDGGVGAMVGRREVGKYLREKIFRPGRRYRWEEMLERATGSRLEIAHFVDEVTGALERA